MHSLFFIALLSQYKFIPEITPGMEGRREGLFVNKRCEQKIFWNVRETMCSKTPLTKGHPWNKDTSVLRTLMCPKYAFLM